MVELSKITISENQQMAIIALFIFLFIITLQQPSMAQATVQSQSFLTDVAQDLGFDKTFSMATTVLATLALGMLVITYFFPKK